VATHASCTADMCRSTPMLGNATLTVDPMKGNRNEAAEVTRRIVRFSDGVRIVSLTGVHYRPFGVGAVPRRLRVTTSAFRLEHPAAPHYTWTTMRYSRRLEKPVLRMCGVGATLSLLLSLGPGCTAPAPATPEEEETVMIEEEAREEAPRLNRLQHETSPYLLAHADNPVDWHPWSDEAFAAAREQNKPIFLSIGYASCHWCHVMEEESFSHPSVADVLNRSYIAIKVDKEERPDVDQAYMTIAQLITGQAGWPLNLIMTPEGEPFYIATYVPRESRSDQIGLVELLAKVHDTYWANDYNQDELRRSGRSFVKVSQDTVTPDDATEFPSDAHERAITDLKAGYDSVNGGFGTAPKFPTATRLSYLLNEYHATGDEESLSMVLTTLDRMRAGGIYDHVGTGFHRYAVDGAWLIPHFEKMLYDQALLAEVYLDAFALTGRSEYADTSKHILDYVTTTLAAPEGAFYGAQDADTAGEEGAYYVWSHRELAEVLSDAEYDVLLSVAELPDTTSSETVDATYVISLTASLPDVVRATGRDESEVRALLDSGLNKLAERRATREPPAIDDKISVDWNGLAIAALARAGRVLDDDRLVDEASTAADFLWNSMRRPDGLLMHTYRDGVSSVDGMLEDYAFYSYALIELYQATQDVEHLHRALTLMEQTVDLFWDADAGGFFQVATGGEQLVLQIKPFYDTALPSGNAIAAENLVRLGTLVSDTEMIDMAKQTFEALGSLVGYSPQECTRLLQSHRLATSNSYVAILVGEPGDPVLQALRDAVDETYSPGTLLVVLEGDEGHESIADVIPAATGHTTLDGSAVAYVCDRQMCALPITDAASLVAMLSKRA